MRRTELLRLNSDRSLWVVDYRQQAHTCINGQTTYENKNYLMFSYYNPLSLSAFLSPFFAFTKFVFVTPPALFGCLCHISDGDVYHFNVFNFYTHFFIFIRSFFVFVKRQTNTKRQMVLKTIIKQKKWTEKVKKEKNRDPVTGKNETRKISVSYYRWATTIITYYSRDARSQ